MNGDALRDLWRSYTDEERKRAPKFCPGCGNELSGALGHTVLVYSEYEVSEAAWDTHCPICEWSGDISPDGFMTI